ncbi:hypothetical protein Sste5346_003428 [Sporothrix stenoceras]|uniref:Zn(2)-C6 fungal-type domain-containing protein n=1 Tax=Sporothrix stenoceras TaxID=5173 RepID=A0ABR3ZDV4_9PEZI
MACQACRMRKIKCDRTRPICQNCRLRSSHCTYAGERRQRRHTDVGGGPPRVTAVQIQRRQQEYTPTGHDYSSIDSTALLGNTAPPFVSTHGHSHNRGSPGSQGSSHSLLDGILGDDVGEVDSDTTPSSSPRNPAVWMRLQDGDEYTGPSSGLAAISDVGLEWIRAHASGVEDADADGLCATIDEIRTVLMSHLRQPKCVPPEALHTSVMGLTPLPPPALIRQYVDAYFSSVQTLFPVLDREEFDALWEMYGTSEDMGPPSWHALLNAVVASGCRAALSDEETAAAFQASGRAAWAFFQNALAYEPLIIHHATDLTAVQAMAALTVFAQGLSSPQRLEYTLCSMAVRLAQGLALHRRPAAEWGLTEAEQRQRDRVFWVIYGLDKTIALRCGRPAVLQDDEISCRFPRQVRVHQDDLQGLDLFLCFTRMTRICGAVARQLYSVAALSTPSAQLKGTMDQLLADVAQWMESIPTRLRPGRPIHSIATSTAARMQLLALHATYFYVLCAIYRRFTPLFTPGEEANPETIKGIVEAARALVLLTKHLDVESFTPAWLVFYYPMTALTTLFVHVVATSSTHTTTDASSTRNDMALMEVVVGFFGRLEYVTSGEAAFTKTAEFVRQARIITKRGEARRSVPGQAQQQLPGVSPTSITSVINADTGLTTNSDTGSVPLDITFSPRTLDTLRSLQDQSFQDFLDSTAPMMAFNARLDAPSKDTLTPGAMYNDMMQMLDD